MDKAAYTVVMAHYKQPDYWREAVDSVLKQDYPAIELIFADDASPGFICSEVEEYINQHKQDNLVGYTVFSNEYNLGTVKSLNKGLSLAKGDFIQVMAADDVLFDETVFSKSVQAFDGLDGQDMAVTSCAKLYDEKLEEFLGEFFDSAIGYRRNQMTAREQYESLIFGCVYLASSTVYRRQIFDIIGMFDQRYRLIEDAPFWCAMTKNGYRIHFADFFSILHRMGGVSHPTKESPTPLRREYRMEELAYFSYELAEAIPELSPHKQKLAIEYYGYCKDAYIGVSGMYIIANNDAELLGKVPGLAKSARKNKLCRHFEGWMRGSGRALATCGSVWVMASIILLLASFSSAPAAAVLVTASVWLLRILVVPISLSLIAAIVMWAFRITSLMRIKTILGGGEDE